jgi:hypothetical protein
MKKKYIIFILILAVIGTWGSCKKDFLTIAPAGSLDQSLLQTQKGIETLLIGAYAMIDGTTNQFGSGWESTSSNWVFGSIRGLEANKGTDGGDQPDINPIQTYSEVATNPYLNLKWRAIYEGISRCNIVITVAAKGITAGKITQAGADPIINQAKALRGWYHFEAWRMWQTIPYVDETTDPVKVTNSADVTQKILDDLTVGTTLATNMGAIGRFNQTVCQVFLAKALMQMKGDYAGALALLKLAQAGTKPDGKPIGLAPTFGEIFDIANRNDIESIYTVQYSVNDGAGAWNASVGEVLNFPYKSGGSPGGCCGFFDPTQEFVNSFRTAGGLPLLDNTYNSTPVINDYGVPASNEWAAGTEYAQDAVVAVIAANKHDDTFYKSLVDKNKGNDPATSASSWKQIATWSQDLGPLDPRLDWTVGRKGIPYWDWGLHTGTDWIRDQTYSGPYNPKKAVYKKSQTGQYTDISSWTSGYTANGYRMIRYADLLLLMAECQIETGDLASARTNINLIRERASNPDGFVKFSDGTPAANYVINQYPLSGAPFDTKENARVALRMERKLELGTEGHRFFDMQRWNVVTPGYLVTELGRVLTYEKTMPWGNSLYGSATVTEKSSIYPIPQRQIDLSNGNLVQNPKVQ